LTTVKTVHSRFCSSSQSLSSSLMGSPESLSASSSSSCSSSLSARFCATTSYATSSPPHPLLPQAVRHQKQQLVRGLSQCLSHQTASLAKHLKHVSVDAVGRDSPAVPLYSLVRVPRALASQQSLCLCQLLLAVIAGHTYSKMSCGGSRTSNRSMPLRLTNRNANTALWKARWLLRVHLAPWSRSTSIRSPARRT
jgi:hypothetical protein